MTVLSKELSIELLKAMDLPVHGCMSVEIDLPLDDIAAMVVRYSLKPEALRSAGESLAKAIADA